MNQLVFNSFHSSVAAFSFDLTPATLDCPHQLTVVVDGSTEALSRYYSYEAFKEAIRSQNTGFMPWDSLPVEIAAAEFVDPRRWVSSVVKVGNHA
jgi:hypothetical protein